MTAIASPRLAGALGGAVLGALIWAGLDELGVWSVLKIAFLAGPFIVMLIVGAIAGAFPLFRRLLWVAAGLTGALLVIVMFTPLAASLAHPLVRADSKPSDRLDAIVVLSGGITGDDAMDSQTLDRMLKGIAAFREAPGATLVLSRETWRRGSRVVSDSADQANLLALAGVTAPVLFIDSAASTHDEALRVKRLPAARSWKRIGLVTSPFHTRRACAVFEKVGFTVTCIPAESREGAVRNIESPGERVHAFQGWFYETAGTVDYRMKGWI